MEMLTRYYTHYSYFRRWYTNTTTSKELKGDAFLTLRKLKQAKFTGGQGWSEVRDMDDQRLKLEDKWWLGLLLGKTQRQSFEGGNDVIFILYLLTPNIYFSIIFFWLHFSIILVTSLYILTWTVNNLLSN